MSPTSLGVLAPRTLIPLAVPRRVVSTPYGMVDVYTVGNMPWIATGSPRAQIYAAKEIGIERVVEILALQAINRMMALGDIVLPEDLIDLTTGQSGTFFVNKGYGFLPHHPPYCPDTREGLIEAARHIVSLIPLSTQPRIFTRAVYGGVETYGPLDEETRTMLQDYDIDAAGVGGVPTSFLARELELCYAPIGMVVTYSHPYVLGVHNLLHDTRNETILEDVITEAVKRMPKDRTCLCSQAMQSAREAGRISDDWRTWVETTKQHS